MHRVVFASALALTTFVAWLAPSPAHAFCGFYVGKAGAELYNHASQVVIVRDGERTVLTMSNDYQGSLKDFAMVVPVPTVLQKEQIHIGDRKLVERIDAYSAPRLVEYFDPDPCSPMRGHFNEGAGMANKKSRAAEPSGPPSADSLGVKIEAQYTVGEYNIVILSAEQSDGLETWLKQSGYQIPPRAAKALEPYIKQNMKFFVAKVDLSEQAKTGFSYLRPIQIAYESEKFMLPIRLGMANAHGGEQDLLIYTLTRKGRVESTNYKTDKVPSGETIPLYVKDEFPRFYQAVFQKAHEKDDYRAVHTEYVWNSGNCDPCADSPLSPDELRGLGVFWLDEAVSQPYSLYGRRRYGPPSNSPIITRLHVKYDSEHFPEDLMFQETGDMANFQARYVLQHPFKGDTSCPAGQQYLQQLEQRHEQEASTLADITGWKREEIVKKMGGDAPSKNDQGGDNWYKNLWK
jgi:hypothetical protein